jgi:uncharacterized DUF497 family protein
MRFTFDPAKNEKNIAERGLSFAVAADLDWEAALIVEDTRHDYGEVRFACSGYAAWPSARRCCHPTKG